MSSLDLELVDPRSQGFVEFSSRSPKLKFTCRMGQGPPKIIQGYGGWEEISRPKRTALTEWTGRSPYKLSLPILFDGWAGSSSVEPKIKILERMAIPPAKGKPPPVLRIKGPIPHSDLAWVIATDGIEWADDTIYLKSQRIRQGATITLLQYVADAIAQVKSAASDARAAGRPGGEGGIGNLTAKKTADNKVYPVKSGDSLVSIAARELGDGARWHEIGDLNEIRDPLAISEGLVIRLP